MSGQDPQCECLPHWQFWLGFAGMAAGVVVSYTGLNYDVERLRAWQDQTQGNRFTASDWARERVLLQKEIEAERTFSRSLCREVKRLAIELKRVPSNNCDGP